MSYIDAAQDSSATSLDWASLIITIISINVSWWIADIPKLWTSGLKPYVDAVTWQCLRVSMPSVAGVFAVWNAAESHDLPKLYYHGFDPKDEKSGLPMSILDITKAFTIDSLTVVATCITIYKACQLPNTDGGDVDLSGWNASMWCYPTLPVAIIGLWTIAASFLKLRNKWLILAIGALLLALACLTFTLILCYLSPAADESNIWIGSLIMYIYMSIPVALIFPATAFQIMAPAASVFARVIGVTAGAMSSRAYFPFCQLKNDAFGGTYLAFGILAGVLAIYGRFKWDRVRYVFRPKTLRAGTRQMG